ncbi:hypothetical protein HPB48_014419 [Haemaphysalis longicornis]|uniref:Uncharacterized protein n=1 Tax=Haemaphysalis longicornis TaxID=44386 RepID=A0A9J6FAA3_HAELO|nr:hypothetical protein HPB48_014419 [Haemaphysalis longicornis]
MLTRFVELKDFANDFLSREEIASSTDSMWAKVEVMMQSLQPAQEATKVLQIGQLTIRDLYAWWLADVFHEDISDTVATGTGPGSVHEETRTKSLQCEYILS